MLSIELGAQGEKRTHTPEDGRLQNALFS